jgi:DNA replication protein DnaC
MNTNLYDKLNQIKPTGIQPKFKTVEELRAFQAQEQLKSSELVNKNRSNHFLKKLMSESGIIEKMKTCSFDNYKITNEGQQSALDIAKQYALNYENEPDRGFIFFGNSGTGKNHLACAIANHLIAIGKTVLIDKAFNIVSKINECYSDRSTLSDTDLIRSFSKPDLLIIDEVGLQRKNNNEQLLLTSIIDNRINTFKATAILTNEDPNSLEMFLGFRSIDRIHEGKPVVVNFNWGSFRRGNK